MKNLAIILAAAAVILAIAKSGPFAFQASNNAQDAAFADSQQAPAVLAATFTSAWCSACKIIEPRLKVVRAQFRAAPVRFVEFDFTFGEAKENLALADELGVTDVYGRFKAATGYTLLIDAQSGELLGRLTASHSADTMRALLAEALMKAQSEQKPSTEQTTHNVNLGEEV